MMTLDTPAAVVLELMTMVQQSGRHLGGLLGAASSPASPHQELAAEILRCCGRVIDALRATNGSKKRKAPEYQVEAAPAPAPGAWSPPPPPPGPPPKRRARGAEAVREVTSDTMVDGFIWRKYGQKDINGHKHPRLYYRCAHKQQGCDATRRVQRTREQPAAYEIAYYGEHTCRGAAAAACHLLQQGGAPPPAVVDFGSNYSRGSPADAGRGSPASMSQGGGWSSSSASSEVGLELEFEAHAHEWHDTAAADELMCASATPPCYASDPVTEFLDGCLGWESVLGDPLAFGGLHDIALFP